MTRFTPITLVVALSSACGWWSSPATVEPPPPDAEPDAHTSPLPDLVFLTLDTTRADHLGLYGYPRDTSPHLDAFGDQALVFERHIVPMATTLPTHTTLFTGVWPIEHGITANLRHGGQRFVTSEQLTPFARWASAQGYTTAGFVSAAVLRAETGIAAGFDMFNAPRRYERRARRTIDRALSWLGQADATSDPIMLWVHLFDPHNPYAPPPGWLQRFEGEDPAHDAWLAARQHAETGTRPTGEVVRTDVAVDAYDAEIAYMDQEVARLLGALQSRDRWDRTVVVIAGDHGEGLNQHGEPGHGLVWDEQLHAPLLIRVPGQTPRRIPTTLSTADVLPTLLGLLDLPAEDGFLGQVSGQDVLGDGFVERAVFSMRSMRQTTLGKDMVWTLTGAGHKCRVDASGGRALYDLSTDPHELTPRAEDPRLPACAEALEAERVRQERRQQALGSGRSTPMDPSEREALEALGYVEHAHP